MKPETLLRAFSPWIFAAAAHAAFLPLLLRFSLSKRHRQRLADRLGHGEWLEARSCRNPRIWLHAASVGEVGGSTPILTAFRRAYPDSEILVTTTSVTGLRRAHEEESVTAARLLPFDHPRVIRRAIESFSPDLCIVTETEIWPNFLLALKERGIPAALVNARISDYTYPNYTRFRSLFIPALEAMSCVLTQTEIDAERFLGIGLPQNRIHVVGSTKYDKPLPQIAEEEKASYASELGLDFGQPIFVAGSVRDTEDRAVLDAFLTAKKEVPELQMIIAPRHPERFNDVAALLSSRQTVFHRRSEGRAGQRVDVLLLDTLGELVQAYALSSFAFVGASLVDIGGHNPLEPAAYHSPVLMGPYLSNVRDAVSALEREGGFFQVANEEELAETLLRLMRDGVLRERAGRAAYRVWQSNLGASKRVMEHLLPLLQIEEPRTMRANSRE